MDKLPSQSLSKSILIATPLFCLILALLDSSDELSYLFVLQFLGNVAGSADILFIPTLQPEVRSNNFAKDQAFISSGIEVSSVQSNKVFLLNYGVIDTWAKSHQIIRGVSPRWIIPVQLPMTDSLLLVTNITNQLNMGLGLKSGLSNLGKREVSVSHQLLSKLQLKIGDHLPIKLSIANLLKGNKLIQKYQSFQSKEQYVVEEQQQNIDKLSQTIYDWINPRLAQWNISLNYNDIRNLVKQSYELQLQSNMTIKYQYKNNGLYSSTLHNVVLMEFAGLVQMLSEVLLTNIIRSKSVENLVFQQFNKSGLSYGEIQILKGYFKLAKNSDLYISQLQSAIHDAVTKYPLLIVGSFNNRQLIYHPNEQLIPDMKFALQTAPGEAQMVSIYPFYEDLQGIRYFFKSVLQIFTFICAVIYFYILRLILKQIYEEKEIQVGIWRTLGAGGVKRNINNNDAKQFELNNKLSLVQNIRYSYQMLVKVGFLYYWLLSALVSSILYAITKETIYRIISSLLYYESPPQQLIYPFLVFISVFLFTMGLAVLHLRQIYTNPLVQTIKPVKRTFDLVKVRIIKIATFGITIETLVIACMLIYYGVVSYYWIPVSILYNDGWLQTTLFNSIFLFMIFGAIMLLTVLQSRMQVGVLKLLFLVSNRLNRMCLIVLKTIKAKQYKNVKVSIIIAVIFAFLLFFTSGIRIEMMIVQSFIERQLGAQLVMQNYQKHTFDRVKIQNYLNSQPVKYSWLSNNLNSNNLKIQFRSMVTNQAVPANFKVLTANYLNTTFYQYYYPQQYITSNVDQYQVLDNGVVNGFSSIYQYDGHFNNQSVGRYNPNNQLTNFDPNLINLGLSANVNNQCCLMAPQEQIIEVAVTTLLRKKLGVMAGDYYKLRVSSVKTGKKYFLRCRIVHSFKVGPGIDLYSSLAFISEEQAAYIYRIMGEPAQSIKFQKLFVSGSNLEMVGNKIISMSPEHTQLFEMGTVQQSFQLLQDYLSGFIVLITIILGSLSVLFLFVYTYGKCKQEADVFKMLRAIGLQVKDIRLMVFLQILIRIVISIINGICLGIVFSVGLSKQIQQILLINTPALEMKTILLIGVVMLVLFAGTVIGSTKYLKNRTVLETNKC